MASMKVLRTWLPTKRPKGRIVDLVGTGTAWTSSTVFSVSGVAGCSILTKIVNQAAQTARLVIATGSTAGSPLTISETTNSTSGTIAVYDADGYPKYAPFMFGR